MGACASWLGVLLPAVGTQLPHGAAGSALAASAEEEEEDDVDALLADVECEQCAEEGHAAPFPGKQADLAALRAATRARLLEVVAQRTAVLRPPKGGDPFDEGLVADPRMENRVSCVSRRGWNSTLPRYGRVFSKAVDRCIADAKRQRQQAEETAAAAGAESWGCAMAGGGGGLELEGAEAVYVPRSRQASGGGGLEFEGAEAEAQESTREIMLETALEIMCDPRNVESRPRRGDEDVLPDQAQEHAAGPSAAALRSGAAHAEVGDAEPAAAACSRQRRVTAGASQEHGEAGCSASPRDGAPSCKLAESLDLALGDPWKAIYASRMMARDDRLQCGTPFDSSAVQVSIQKERALLNVNAKEFKDGAQAEGYRSRVARTGG